MEWRDLLHCAVCLRAFEECETDEGLRLPVSLVCGHTICRGCLTTCTSSSQPATLHKVPGLRTPSGQTLTVHGHGTAQQPHTGSPRGKAATCTPTHALPDDTAADNNVNINNKSKQPCNGVLSQQQQQRLPLDRRHACPLDHTVHAIPLTQLPVNVALAHLLGLRVPPQLMRQQQRLPEAVSPPDPGSAYSRDIPEGAEADRKASDSPCTEPDLHESPSASSFSELYQGALSALDSLALLVSGGAASSGAAAGAIAGAIPLRTPVYPVVNKALQRKILTLMQCQLLLPEGRTKCQRAARSICERIVTELIVMHQNTQQLTSHLWSAVRARGCQFLGPAMQEEVLKLVLLALETGSALSRKVLVMFIVQKLKPQYSQASKTSVGHVVQLLYRASCFKVSKRDGDSSLMELKEEFRVYDALRKEHDAQIIQIAQEAGLRIAPEQWSALLYGDHLHKSHMQSIIDKLQSTQYLASSVQELIIAVQRSGDPQGLLQLRPALDQLAGLTLEDTTGAAGHGGNAAPPATSPGSASEVAAACASMELVAVSLQNLLHVVSGFLFFMANNLAKKDMPPSSRVRSFAGADGHTSANGGIAAGRVKHAYPQQQQQQQAAHRALSLSRSLPQSYSQPSFTSFTAAQAQHGLFPSIREPTSDAGNGNGLHSVYYPALNPLLMNRRPASGVFAPLPPQQHLVGAASRPAPPAAGGGGGGPPRSALSMSLSHSASVNLSSAGFASNMASPLDSRMYRPISRQASVPATMRTLEGGNGMDGVPFPSPGSSHGGQYNYVFGHGGRPQLATGFRVGSHSDLEQGGSLSEEHGSGRMPRDYGAYEAARAHAGWSRAGMRTAISPLPLDDLEDEQDGLALGMPQLHRPHAELSTFNQSLSHSRRLPSSSGNLLDEYARWRDDASTAQGIHRISSLSSELAGVGGGHMRASRSAVFHADYAGGGGLDGYFGSPPCKPLSRLMQSTTSPSGRAAGLDLEQLSDRDHEDVLTMRLCSDALGEPLPDVVGADFADQQHHREKWAAACLFSLSDEEPSS
ncbi:roquin-1-like [Paramacrobiotus metropolitanus]|uniref:roquin-1-like n=1 Tax=Paramacrobiotus metropolitanus TaxID=2943436 RepID=UPI0024463F2E|nr:roquin-1-like [Paramacrobiotus metropolitanus]XP_055336943.1 roquin-1-like [Paramacrobiotus metropolitanus]XP_055336944.1 roquin-1-like [Paramacrobiotus metropolitanus]XP_055336945.1 roquin-1-like [Paramacrobiotus metropolitanus]XP_055336946.1 roquin-1-like [Paramacrobiotus metropolitanus]XP_055336947.1 roquin-1-like [Paramacrobiotus metropolitanus]XP_055336948.1 roquin-1-like [Paramacrobiotus metropolitanus]XP_055336949.1 roquin-1-like [Paramacrobiotus metropolitanus]